MLNADQWSNLLKLTFRLELCIRYRSDFRDSILLIPCGLSSTWGLWCELFPIFFRDNCMKLLANCVGTLQMCSTKAWAGYKCRCLHCWIMYCLQCYRCIAAILCFIIHFNQWSFQKLKYRKAYLQFVLISARCSLPHGELQPDCATYVVNL
jgi:hypothetical protein